ncbi:MAG: N-6 DNA methylase [bacterium]
MSESISQGLPTKNLGNGIKLYKINDVSFTALKKDGFDCLKSNKKPDQLICKKQIILAGIEEKDDSSDLEIAVKQIKDNYLTALPNTNYFIARAGDRVKVFFRIGKNHITEIGTTLKGKEVFVFGPKVVTGENKNIIRKLKLFVQQIVQEKEPINGSLEINPPKAYYNPLIVKQSTIYSLWQKIFVSTGENAPLCLATFVELLLFKGVSDSKLLPSDFTIETLADKHRSNSLETYKNVVRNYIKTNLFPTTTNQPGVINGFAFEEQETVFKTVLTDLINLGNLAQRQIDPDFKRRVIEAFLGSAHKEGTIKSGKHLTPRNIIQAIWEMASPAESSRIVDPACGVGGFVLEGLNYPYEFSPLKYRFLGIDRDEQMIITAKANMILHILDKLADPKIDNKILNKVIHESFYQAKNNGTGTLGELTKSAENESAFKTNHQADYVFANVPFYVNGVRQIDESLDDIGYHGFYKSCGLGIESRFIKYILNQIKNGKPGIAFVIVTDGVLYRQKDNVRNVINEHADVLGIVSLPEGIFQNNNWKTSIIIFKKKESIQEYKPVFLYDINSIGISLDSYRTPTEENDIPSMKKAWDRRYSGDVADPKCKLVSREIFLKTEKWIDLFDYCREIKNDNKISISEFIESAEFANKDIQTLLLNADKSLSEIFSLENSLEVKLGDKKYFKTGTADYQTTIKFARHNPGNYPLYSSQVDGPVEYMENNAIKPILLENEKKSLKRKIISWNIKGDPCKDIRFHTNPFYVTENRGLIEIVDDRIDLSYVLYFLREHMIELGRFSRSNEAHAGKVKALKIKIPLDIKGQIDLQKQKVIAKKYEEVLKLRESIKSKISEFESLLANIDIFK